MRATLATTPDGTKTVDPFPKQDSSLQVTLARADCLVIREPFARAAEPGAPCDIISLEF
jgi:molybdopterin molybdotransferase